ncbi:putative deoxyribonuclease TATDN3-like protein [Gigaspora rosea]|uniref:Putative deoxyribonuclease TATDN3-like protein n=1 Tax=Gigaspora rosea TaxID=44941 RepID=A0A397VMQ6_9GLOM|nr:putative deoxyribonuclease TATDN3-like protein [Gigaspora rosea]
MDGHIVDVHAHLYPSSFPTTPIEQILTRAKAVNVSSIITVPETLEDAQSIFELKNDLTLSNSLRDMIEPCAGLHPVTPQGAMSLIRVDQADSILQFIKDKSTELVGIGEVGLDFSPRIMNNAIAAYPDLKLDAEDLKNVQRTVLARHIDLSLQFDLPLNVHSRSAGHHTLDCLRDYGARKVVMHAFDGRIQYANKGVEMGFFFSIPPSIVRSPQKQKLVAAIPLSNLLLETDSPALGPEQGVDNEPDSIVISATEIAKVKKIDVSDVIRQTTENAYKLFPKIKKNSI